MHQLVVVGAGVIGLSCAWRATAAGWRVTVLDPAPARGASWVAGGMLAPVTEAWPGEEELLDFGLESLQRWPAFAADLMGSKLPERHGPWTVTGAIGPDNAPPHNFSRNAIEEAIGVEGFQLWRLGKATEVRA